MNGRIGERRLASLGSMGETVGTIKGEATMIRNAALVLLASLASQSIAQSTPSRAQYKTAVLGMTLEEWKALPFPDPATKGTLSGAICTDNPKWSTFDDVMPARKIELDMGVVMCSYYTDTVTKLGILLGSHTFTMRSRVSIGRDYTMFDSDYSFYKGRLFRIRGLSQVAATDDMIEGLTARFGKPAVVGAGAVQNKLGATFPKSTYTWDLSDDVIQVDSPGGGKVDTVSIIYVDKAAAAIVKAEQERLDPALNKM